MAWYRCYYNSVGGGKECEGPMEFKSEEDAMDYAREIAVEDYEMFEECHGIPDIGDIKDFPEDFNLDSDADEDEYWDAYIEEREKWLDYWVEEASGSDDIDEDYQ